MNDSTARFSDRVENYVKFRPNYPEEIFELLSEKCDMGAESIVADIGSGTGILSANLVDRVKRLFAIEPNSEMRAAAELWLGAKKSFESLSGTAENTGLETCSVDLVVAGQAFHWFDRRLCKVEFKRILRPKAWVALVWNERLLDTTEFLIEYESLLRTHATDYEKVNHMNIDMAAIESFFAPNKVELFSYPNFQRFDFEGLSGRILSSSYMPNKGSEKCRRMLSELKKLFDQHEEAGFVEIEYDTNVYLGQLNQRT